jgi:hypothetical protein
MCPERTWSCHAHPVLLDSTDPVSGSRYHQLTLPLTAGLEQNRFSERLIRPPQDGEVILYGQRPTL